MFEDEIEYGAYYMEGRQFVGNRCLYFSIK